MRYIYEKSNFIFKATHISNIYIVCLIPLIITNIYLHKSLIASNPDDLFIRRYFVGQGIYVNILILFFGILLANSIKNIFNKFPVELNIFLKALFFGIGCFLIYVYYCEIDFILNKNISMYPKEPYYFFFTTTRSFCSLLIFYYFSFIIIIKISKKKLTAQDNKTIDDAISTITSGYKSTKDN